MLRLGRTSAHLNTDIVALDCVRCDNLPRWMFRFALGDILTLFIDNEINPTDRSNPILCLRALAAISSKKEIFLSLPKLSIFHLHLLSLTFDAYMGFVLMSFSKMND